MLSVFPRDVLDEIWDLIESVSEGFPTYFFGKMFRDITFTGLYNVLSEMNCDVSNATCRSVYKI